MVQDLESACTIRFWVCLWSVQMLVRVLCYRLNAWFILVLVQSICKRLNLYSFFFFFFLHNTHQSHTHNHASLITYTVIKKKNGHTYREIQVQKQMFRYIRSPIIIK